MLLGRDGDAARELREQLGPRSWQGDGPGSADLSYNFLLKAGGSTFSPEVDHIDLPTANPVLSPGAKLSVIREGGTMILSAAGQPVVSVVFSLLDDSAGNAPVTADLANPSAPTGRPGEGDHLLGVERLRGSYGDDVLRGDNGPNTLDGVSGNDTLEGRGGADVIQGAGGLDHIDAGPGDDIIDAVIGDDDIPPELLPETPACGDGTDSVARPEPGVLIGPDCEQVGLGGYIGGFAQARPLAVGDGSATFAVPCPKGLLDTLSINGTNAIATCAGAVMVTAVDGTPLGTGSFGPTPAGSAATATAAGQAAFAAPGTNVLVEARATLTGNPMGQARTAGTYRVPL